MSALENLTDRTNEVLREMDDLPATIFAARFDDLTWETIAGALSLTIGEVQEIYEDACDELRRALEAAVPASNPDEECA